MKPVCLIIGAGAGIGGSVGRHFAANGYHSVLCRRTDQKGLEHIVNSINDEGADATGYLLNAIEPGRLEQTISKVEAEQFYKVHQSKPFYNDLCNYLSSGPIIVMCLEKENAVLDNRNLMGSTNPKEAKDGTLRKKYGLSIDKNSVHGSDSVDNAKIEIDFFFKN